MLKWRSLEQHNRQQIQHWQQLLPQREIDLILMNLKSFNKNFNQVRDSTEKTPNPTKAHR